MLATESGDRFLLPPATLTGLAIYPILSGMTISLSQERRRRRAPEVIRQEAIAVARRILVSDGPSAVTLQSVAGALRMAHGNITHHFGSAANLQAALADTLIADLLTTVVSGTRDLRAGVISEADLVKIIFDVFEESGVGRLFGWLAAQRSPHLAPLYSRLGRLPDVLASDSHDESAFTADELHAVIATLVVSALGASLIGRDLSDALDLPRSFMRAHATADLRAKRVTGRARKPEKTRRECPRADSKSGLKTAKDLVA